MPQMDNMENLRRAIREFRIKDVLVRELGWDQCTISPQTVDADGVSWTLNAIAIKRGMVVFQCEPGHTGALPEYATRNKIERKISKTAYEHMVVYVDAAKNSQVWQWSKKEPGKPVQRREGHFHKGGQGEALAQRLSKMAFTLSEEGRLTHPEAVARVNEAARAEKVTKKFYERFTEEHKAFLKFIEGIREQGDKDWYASLMLNRMMFVYFIQKKGFLDGDTEYLRNRLKKVQAEAGHDRFHGFYRTFLLTLFHSGLGQPEASRSAKDKALLGKIPYLNGGLFDVHDLERDNANIKIADKAFERVFDFFDEFEWHLDTRQGRADNEINPDVLGYIFEKYINQKQMGAYYTKEDITGYISRNTIIPFLFDDAKKRCATAFKADGGIWELLKENPDRYVYPAVKHGITWNYRASAALSAPVALPANIEVGIASVAKRGDWNKVATEEAGLPTETWREVVARRQRYDEIVRKLRAGEVTDINDFITLNLDIERFALDVIEQAESSDLVKAFWEAVTSISVLDPTCGSGAFLFAALEILHPLYEACLEAANSYIEDLDRADAEGNKNKLKWAREALKQLEPSKHPSRDYFVYKSIVINNLYGVDIMEEAVEICKLRLFLKLVAQLETVDQIEPLPDIDFNIRAGNTLVGFASLAEIKRVMEGQKGNTSRRLDFGGEYEKIAERAEEASRAFAKFREMQTLHSMDGALFSDAKQELRKRLSALRTELNSFLSADYGVPKDKPKLLEDWRESHRPLHWPVEFFSVFANGGFSAVIGNPPYVNVKKISYRVRTEKYQDTTDIYAPICARSLDFLASNGRFGMIVPLSITFSEDFGELRAAVAHVGRSWISSYDNIPAALFDGVSQRCSIWIAAKSNQPSVLTAPMYRWRSEYRPCLIDVVNYTPCIGFDLREFGIPKFGSAQQGAFLKRMSGSPRRAIATGDQTIGFAQAARNFVSVFLETPPCLSADKLKPAETSKVGFLKLRQSISPNAALAALASDTFFWYWLVRGDGFDVTGWILRDFLAAVESCQSSTMAQLDAIGALLHHQRNAALAFKLNAGKFVGNYNFRRIGSLVRRADLLLLSDLGEREKEVIEILEYVERVLSINVFAGEKGIPDNVRARYPIPNLGKAHRELLAETDKIASDAFQLEAGELQQLLRADRDMA